jgi:hypothetical protein
MVKIDNWTVSHEPDTYCGFAERCHESGYATAHLNQEKLTVMNDDIEGNHVKIEIPVEIVMQLMQNAGYTVTR